MLRLFRNNVKSNQNKINKLNLYNINIINIYLNNFIFDGISRLDNKKS